MPLVEDSSGGLITNDLTTIIPAEALFTDAKAGQVVLMADGEPVNWLASVCHVSN